MTPQQQFTPSSADQPGNLMQSDTTPTNTPQPTQRKPMPIGMALLIMFAPGIIIVGSIILYAIFNFLFSGLLPETPIEGTTFSEDHIVKRIINIILFLAGAVSIIAALPCLVLGIIFLARR